MSLAKQLCEAVRREIREAAIFELPSRPAYPLPHDAAAERMVVSALLNGQRRPSELRCSAGDFFAPVHRAVVAVVAALEDCGKLSGPVDLSRLGRLLQREARVSADRIASELLELRDLAPFRLDIERVADRVVELAHQRRASGLMQQIDGAWRCGLPVAPALVAALRAALARWESRCDG